MKNKKAVYPLLALSVIVWGTVGWKIYDAFHAQVEIAIVPKETGATPKDTTILSLNYRDPFLEERIARPAPAYQREKKPIEPTISLTSPQAPASTGPALQYKGLVAIGQARSAIIQKEGETFTLKIGETIDGYKLIAVNDHMITLSGKDRKTHEIAIR